MDQEDWFDSYRYELFQIVADWNNSEDPKSLTDDPPVYQGEDWRVSPKASSGTRMGLGT